MPSETSIRTEAAVCFGCAQQCGVLVRVENERVTEITGDRSHPVSAGFVCPKGAGAHVLHNDESRIQVPLKRVGPRGSGSWQEITWDQALDEIAEKISSLSTTFGPETLAYSYGTLHGSDSGIGERFMHLFDSPNAVGQDKVCYGPNALGESLTYGFGTTFYTAPVAGKTGCIVVWGFRPSASMPLMWGEITRARREGAKLIVIDPERTHEAEVADLWLQSRPGSDVALALSLIHCIVSEGMHDDAFVEKHTSGFAELAARALEYTPARAAELTWVAEEDIVAAARMIAREGPTLVQGGNGLCQSGSTAVQSGRALACLISITGNIGVEGAHALVGPPRDVVANGDAVLADSLSDAQRDKRLGGSTFATIGPGYRALDEAMSRRWYGKQHILSWLSTGHEPTLWQAITNADPYPVKALVVQGHNAVGACANAGAAIEALTSENLELLVVHDLFLNPTSRLADYLLPACHWLEKPFYSAGIGYMGFAGDYAEATRAPIAAEAEHRSDYELWRDLGHRLDQASYWPETAEEFWDSLVQPAGLDFPTLCEHRGPVVGNDARRARSEGDETQTAFGTPSGKIELRSSLLESWGIDPLPHFELPPVFAGTEGAFPLVLTTGGRKIEGFHQNAQQMPWFREKYPHPLVSIHPTTAADAGIREGEWVRVETPIGAVRQQARLTDTLPQQVVHADRWWYPERADDTDDPFGFSSTNINLCTEGASESCDPIMGAWLLRGLPCRVACD